MKAKNLIGGIMIVVLAYILISKITTGQYFSNIFSPKLTIEVGANIVCQGAVPIYKYCCYDPGSAYAQVSNGFKFEIQPYALINHPSKIHIYATLTYPDGSTQTQSKDLAFSSEGVKKIYLTFPLNGKGEYDYSVKVCGNWFGLERCDTRTGAYVYG